MNLRDKFAQLKNKNKKAFIAYIPFAYPSRQYTKDIILSLCEGGVDIIEIGLPFSDPLADGPIIQEANNIALREGATPEKFFKQIKTFAKDIPIPLVAMTYYNPVFKYGTTKFLKRAKEASLSGLIIVDFPLEEAASYIKETDKFNLERVFFITPTTPLPRMHKVINATNGFIYYVSAAAITGPRELLYHYIAKRVKEVKKITSLSVCVGFGIHNPEQVAQIASFADGVIVGSALVKFIKENFKKTNFYAELKKYVKYLRRGCL